MGYYEWRGYRKKQVVVEFGEKMAKPEDLIDKIEEAGFKVRM